jgi:hypothetical protein
MTGFGNLFGYEGAKGRIAEHDVEEIGAYGEGRRFYLCTSELSGSRRPWRGWTALTLVVWGGERRGSV